MTVEGNEPEKPTIVTIRFHCPHPTNPHSLSVPIKEGQKIIPTSCSTHELTFDKAEIVWGHLPQKLRPQISNILIN